jgi:hypothetical protein
MNLQQIIETLELSYPAGSLSAIEALKDLDAKRNRHPPKAPKVPEEWKPGSGMNTPPPPPLGPDYLPQLPGPTVRADTPAAFWSDDEP